MVYFQSEIQGLCVMSVAACEDSLRDSFGLQIQFPVYTLWTQASVRKHIWIHSG